MKLLFVLLAVCLRLSVAFPTVDDDDEQRDDVDSEQSRKIIGQSVVTSVSVIMNGAGDEPHYTDAVGKTVPRPRLPPRVASPINLLNPDRYEFYTFNDMGELVKRLMTLKEIQGIVANGNGAQMIGDNEHESQSVDLNSIPLSNQDERTQVQDIVDNVQQVLSREMENNRNASQISHLLDTPDVSSTWSMILPAIFGNTGDEIRPHRPINMTPETEIIDTTTKFATTRRPTTKYRPTIPEKDKTKKPTRTTAAPTKAQSSSSSATTTKKQILKTKPRPTTTVRRPTTRPTESIRIEAPTQEASKTNFVPTYEITQPPSKATFPPTTVKFTQETFKTTLPQEVTIRTTQEIAKTTVPQTTTTQEITRTTVPQTTTFKVTEKPSTVHETTVTEKFTPEETVKTTLSQPTTTTTVRTTPAKKVTKKPTPTYKRPLTNSPIVIEKIPKRPAVHHYEAKTEAVDRTERTTMMPTTVEMKPDPSTRVSVSIAPPTHSSQKTTPAVKTEAPSTTTRHQTTSEKPTVSTTPKQIDTTVMDRTTLTASEEDRQDLAINQIIGSLQNDLFKNYEAMPTTDQPIEETTVYELAMDKSDELSLAPDKILLNDELFIEEEEPVVKDLPTTTMKAEEATTVDMPVYEKLQTLSTNSPEISLENSEVMQTLEKLIAEQANVKTKVKLEKLDILGFDDDDETEIKLNETLDSKKKDSHAEFVTKAATVASILSSTKTTAEPTTTTTEAPTEESDTTVPTILSDALSNVIQLMIESQKAKETKTTTTQKPSNEPSEIDLNNLLHHYANLSPNRDQLEALSQLNEQAVTTTQKAVESSTSESENVSYETTVVRETSSVSVKKAENQEVKAEAVTVAPEELTTTIDPVTQEFSTFFFVDKHEDDTTSDPLTDGLGAFTTEQFVETEKKLSDRKEEETFTFPNVRLESEEDSAELVSGILNAIGIVSDEEDEASTESLKDNDSQESDEVENALSSLTSTLDTTLNMAPIKSLSNTLEKTVQQTLGKDPVSRLTSSIGETLQTNPISSLTSTLDKTLSSDVKTDISLTSELASSLISVADSISDSLTGEEDSDESTKKSSPKAEATTAQATTMGKTSTEKANEKILVAEKVAKATKKNIVKKVLTTTTEAQPEEATESEEAKDSEETTVYEKIVQETTEISTEADSTEKLSTSTEAVEKQPEKVGSGPMLHLSVIRKDNSLEEIDFFTPPSPTTTKVPMSEGNFIKIENIETTTAPKLSGLKNKSEEVEVQEKPIFVALRGPTTTKTSALPEAVPSQPTTFESTTPEEVATERVPLIEITKPSEVPISSTEDNLVEIKVQTKPTVAIPTTTEDHQTTIFQHQPNAQTIKNIIKISQQQTRPQLPAVELSIAPEEALGLAASTEHLNTDLSQFADLCNKLAFSFWQSITADGISQARSVIISPFALTSMLSMIFLGARGETSEEMNDLLRLDDMVTFNPHVVIRNITESIEQSKGSGVAAAAFVRELYSERSKGKLLPYFKEKAQQYYGAHVEEVNFDVINDILRRRTNLLVKRHTFNKINEYLKTNNIWVNEPLAAISANVFLTDCTGALTNERDGEMFFQVSPAVRQRRLIPIPAAVYRSGFTAGYDPILDATAVAFGDGLQSTIMVMPGQQGSAVPGDNLERLENAFNDPENNAWARLLTTFMERPGLEVQIPRFSHRSLINTTFALQQMGLKDIFDANKADLRGLTGAKSKDLHFSDLLQINQFSTCGEDKIADSHHIEIYPSPSLKRELFEQDREEDGRLEISSPEKHASGMQYKSLYFDPIYDSRFMNVPLPLRPRQARLPDNPRLRFDRPFLYFVRHNPTGIILFMGRFNPRLLP